MQDWIDLSERGYWVFPTKHRHKYPTTLKGVKWDQFIDGRDQELLHAHVLHSIGSQDVTGACVCPQSSDPVKLLVLDFDTYGVEFDDLWMNLSDEPPETTTLVVQSPSGGFHLWFRLTDDVNAEQLPATFDLGNEIKGELRASSKARRMIMLPGSLVTNKNGKAARYEILQGKLDPTTLPPPPGSLMSRIISRKGDTKPETDGNQQPTEVQHFMREVLPRLVGSIEEGGRNNFVSKIGQILGRLHPGEQPRVELMQEVFDLLSPRLGDDFKQKEFAIAFKSGWSTGSKNGDKYQARAKHPSVTDVKAECTTMFGALPWLVEVRDSAGKTKEYIVGFGGSNKRRHEAKRVTQLKDLRDLLPTLTRLSNASMDAVARSPLFIQPGWSKVLEFMLMTEKAVDQLGIPAEERFFELLEDWARIAAGDLLFLEAWTEKRPQGSAIAFIVWPLSEEQAPALVIPPMLQEAMITQLGDIPKAKKLAGKYLLPKTLVGMRKGQQVWSCPLTVLQEETRDFIGMQYEQYVRSKEKQDD